ncbi:MerR family transcriptional regulator [Bacillus sp. FJAT-49736]|uniref:helix-turn-helix domain-containing protein n=1 Tax=Bacillus sp. FJAT-49736 TaxID=2833582 RepID=UPI001BCA171C|nr:MerR family transcriptional regulator [Bacillus sp. FJAT-49736]MBS4171743.1 MerR family transcriptional regulator [Bacillus sp. FJAT-49736]
MHLTIQEFSKRTGLPPSKLRFYDKKGLLQPSTRLENGYRAYSIDQIDLAKMIDSLRNADISIKEIQLYCDADEQKKRKMLERWKKEIDKRMEVLHAAKKYVGGINVENNQTILLSKWEKEKCIVWQRFESERGPHPFREHFLTARNYLENIVTLCSEDIYVKTEQITKNKIIGEVGFAVDGSMDLKENECMRLERIPPGLYAVMQDCRADDAFLCFSYIQMVIRFGFQPAGNKMERYSNIDSEIFDYLIPLIQ